MIKARSMCSLAMVKALTAISCIIRALEKPLLVEVWNLIKKAHGLKYPRRREV